MFDDHGSSGSDFGSSESDFVFGVCSGFGVSGPSGWGQSTLKALPSTLAARRESSGVVLHVSGTNRPVLGAFPKVKARSSRVPVSRLTERLAPLLWSLAWYIRPTSKRRQRRRCSNRPKRFRGCGLKINDCYPCRRWHFAAQEFCLTQN